MTNKQAYQTIAKHIFTARLKYEGNKTVIVLADTLEEATVKAQAFFGLSLVSVEKVRVTDALQVYEV